MLVSEFYNFFRCLAMPLNPARLLIRGQSAIFYAVRLNVFSNKIDEQGSHQGKSAADYKKWSKAVGVRDDARGKPCARGAKANQRDLNRPLKIFMMAVNVAREKSVPRGEGKRPADAHQNLDQIDVERDRGENIKEVGRGEKQKPDNHGVKIVFLAAPSIKIEGQGHAKHGLGNPVNRDRGSGQSRRPALNGLHQENREHGRHKSGARHKKNIGANKNLYDFIYVDGEHEKIILVYFKM